MFASQRRSPARILEELWQRRESAGGPVAGAGVTDAKDVIPQSVTEGKAPELNIPEIPLEMKLWQF